VEFAMRLLASIALLPLLASAATAQDQSATPAVYRIHRLTLVSKDLSREQRHGVIRTFQGGTYRLDELAERIRFKFRDTGYELVEVGEAQITRLRACDADVSYAVARGSQYRLNQITFTSTAKLVFTNSQLRSQFHLEDGAVFNATEIGRSLNDLKDLYVSAGYANFGAIPKPIYDNSRNTISLEIDIDEGVPVTFGKLLLEGTEPRAGVALQLLASWKEELQGKRYNPQQLKDWLKKNSPVWPTSDEDRPVVHSVAGRDPGILNVLLQFE
jgi:hypothetical protein